MEHHGGRPSLAVRDKCHTGLHDLEEVVLVAFSEEFKSRLICGLDEQMVAVAGNRQDEIRCELVSTDIAIEKFGVDRHFCVRPGRLDERIPCIEDV